MELLEYRKIKPIFDLRMHRAMTYPQRAMAFNRSGTKLACYSQYQGVGVLNTPTLTIYHTMNPNVEHVFEMDFDQTETRLAAACSEGVLKVWDFGTRTIKNFHQAEDYDCYFYCTKFHPYLPLVGVGGTSKKARIWCSQTSLLVHSLQGHRSSITSIDFEEQGRDILTTSLDGGFRIWDVETGIMTQRIIAGRVMFGRFFERIFVLAAKKNKIEMWNYTYQIFVQSFTSHSTDNHFGFPRFATVNKTYLIAGSDDNKIYVWDIRTGKVVSIIEAHDAPVANVAANNVANLIASTGEDGTVKLWRNLMW